jgi:transposase-like protein
MQNKSFAKHSTCPHCRSKRFVKKGFFYKKATKSYHQRHRCLHCKKSFSSRTGSATFKQKRPDLNQTIYEFLVSGVTMRRTARLLKISYTTVYKKFLWLSERAHEFHSLQTFTCEELQFDEMESIEHTKLKPLTIALAVDEGYRILGAKVGSIPAKGLLADISLKKYGPRDNESTLKTTELFLELKSKLLCYPNLIKSDLKPSYGKLVRDHFPKVPYEPSLSRGNKEKLREQKHLKQEKQCFDPMFALNHRCAMLRADIKRLTRRSWCTTKLKEHLERHLHLYIAYNNSYRFL